MNSHVEVLRSIKVLLVSTQFQNQSILPFFLECVELERKTTLCVECTEITKIT